MKIIVFGGSGFLGSHVADAALSAGHEVTVFDRTPSKWLRKEQSFIQGDILDEESVSGAVKGMDVVYNFAGMADIEESAGKPLETIRLNVLGNGIILDACRKYEIKRYVYASSVYVCSHTGLFYRTSKRASEMFIEDYQKAYSLPYTILRYGSLYGPRTTGSNFIKSIIRQALKEGKVVREGDGDEIREYIHVMDAARNSIEILAPEFENQIINLTGMHPMRIKDLLTMLKEIFHNKVEISYVPSESEIHYTITPYSYNPRMGRKYVGNSYIDIGQGLLELIAEMDESARSDI